jgi:hypothetical protein
MNYLLLSLFLSIYTGLMFSMEKESKVRDSLKELASKKTTSDEDFEKTLQGFAGNLEQTTKDDKTYTLFKLTREILFCTRRHINSSQTMISLPFISNKEVLVRFFMPPKLAEYYKECAIHSAYESRLPALQNVFAVYPLPEPSAHTKVLYTPIDTYSNLAIHVNYRVSPLPNFTAAHNDLGAYLKSYWKNSDAPFSYSAICSSLQKAFKELGNSSTSSDYRTELERLEYACAPYLLIGGCCEKMLTRKQGFEEIARLMNVLRSNSDYQLAITTIDQAPRP